MFSCSQTFMQTLVNRAKKASLKIWQKQAAYMQISLLDWPHQFT
jgi:hypothetical protein